MVLIPKRCIWDLIQDKDFWGFPLPNWPVRVVKRSSKICRCSKEKSSIHLLGLWQLPKYAARNKHELAKTSNLYTLVNKQNKLLNKQYTISPAKAIAQMYLLICPAHFKPSNHVSNTTHRWEQSCRMGVATPDIPRYYGHLVPTTDGSLDALKGVFFNLLLPSLKLNG